LKVDRLYYLGDYRNIHITDEIVGLPDEFITNTKAVGLIRFMQLLETEKTFQRYLDMSKKYLAGKTAEESVGLLEQLQSDTMSQLSELFSNGKTES